MDDNMLVWDKRVYANAPMPFRLREFYKELIALYKKYNLSISHEDSGGAFIIEDYDESNIDWITGALLDADVFEQPEES